MRPARLLPASLAAALLCSTGGAQAPGAQDVIVLGAAVSLTGKYAVYGANTKNGYELAVRKINDKGGVKVGGKRYKLVVRYYYDESIAQRGSELAERLIKQDGVKFMLGPYGSSLTKAMLPVVEKYKVPMIEGNGEARDLFTRGYRYLFAVLSTSDQYLTIAVDFAAEHADKLGKSKQALRIALAMEDEPFARDVRAGVLDAVMRHGMTVVIDDQLPPRLDDMSGTLAKVKALKPDLILISGREQGALTAVDQIEALRVDVPMIALTHCETAQLVDKRGAAAEHVLCAPSMASLARLQGRAVRHGRGFRARFRAHAPIRTASSGGPVGGGGTCLRRGPHARAEPGPRDGAKRDRRDRTRDILRSGQVRRNRPQHRQAHGPYPGQGRQTCGGVPGRIGHRRSRRAAPAASALAYSESPA